MKRIKILKKIALWRRNPANNYYILLFSSIIVGFLTGLGAVVLKNSVHYVHTLLLDATENSKLHLEYFFFPLTGLILTYLYIKLTKLEIKPGIPNLLYSISKNHAYLKPHNLYSSIIGSILTIGFGGPTGLESSNISTGGGIASYVAKLFKLSYRQRILLLGIASAGTISAIFKAPITGIIFALEVIMIDLTSLSVLPIVIASVTSSLTSYLFTGTNYLYPIILESVFKMKDIPVYIIIGIFMGFFGLLFSNFYKNIAKSFRKINNDFSKFLIAGIISGIIVFIFPATFAEGYKGLNAALEGDYHYLFKNFFLSNYDGVMDIGIFLFIFIAIFKAIGTSVVVAAGGVGGFFTPILFVGANLGLFLSHFLKKLNITTDHQNIALLSMSGLLASMFHAPLTSVFFIGEITGSFSLLLPLLITSSISYIIIRLFQDKNFFSEELARKKILLTHHADHNILTMLDMKKLIETNFITIAPDKKLRDLVEVVKESSRDSFPVVDNDGYFLGLITLKRIRKIMFKQELYDKIKVTDLMFYPQFHAEINDHLEDIIEKFERYHIYNLLVLDKGKYVGFISRSNFFIHYRELLKEFSAD